ncbi:MAG TPA: methyltransferase domain-containing protein [Candidatus Synoicihabitans sp.]|nr:methyltransferase domain-containing protein [Candidatus Synoicihabitans sp.]
MYPLTVPADRLPSFAADAQINRMAQMMDDAIRRAKLRRVEQQSNPSITDFDVRGELYDLAHRVAKNARNDEVERLREWIRPHRGDVALDIAAGGGFLTAAIQEWTGGPVYALDPSRQQLALLRQHVPAALTILGSPDDAELFGRGGFPAFDWATSLGGLHHVDDQAAMFRNVGRVLRRGGRFVLADVCGGTTVAEHFDDHVTAKCLTSHSAQWLTPQRLPTLLHGSGLQLRRTAVLPVEMCFESETQMALFFKGLHAYDLTLEEIAQDLIETLGVIERNGLLCLRWPLLFAELERE